MSRKLIVEIIGDSSSYEKSLERSGKSTQTFGSRLSGLGKTAAIAGGAAGVALLTDALKNSLDIALNDQEAHAKLVTAFKNSGLSAKTYGKQIDGAKDSARELGFKNADVETSLAKLIIPTKNTGKAIDDLRIAEDLARAKHIDLQSATQILTGALAGNQRAVKQLGIVIPPVTKNVEALKKAHQESKTPITAAEMAHAKYQDKLATGQAIIDTVAQKVRGQGKAFSETAEGGMAEFSAKLDDLGGRIGGKLLPVLQGVVSFFNDNWSTIGTVAQEVGNLVNIGIQTIITPMKVLWDLLHGDWSGAWNAIKAPAEAAWGAIKGAIQPVIDLVSGPLTTAWNTLATLAGTVWTTVSGAVSTAFTTISGAVTSLWNPIDSALRGAWNTLSSLASTVWGAISGAVTKAFGVAKTAYETVWNAWFGALKTELGWIRDAGSAVWSALSGAAGAAFRAIKGFVTSVWDGAYGALKSGLNWIKDNAHAAWDALLSAVNAVMGPIKGAIEGVVGIVKDLISALKTAWDWLSKVAGANPSKKVAPGAPYDPKNPRAAAAGGFLGGTEGQPIPIIAHANEFVIRSSATKKIGIPALSYMNATGQLPMYADGGQVPGTQPGGKGDTPAFRASGLLNNDFGVDKWNRDIAAALNAGGRPAIQAAMRSTHVKTAFGGLVELQAGIFGRGGGPARGGLTEKDLAAVRAIPGLSLEDYTPGVNIGYAAALSRVRGGYNWLRSILMNAVNGSASAKESLAQLTSNSWHFGAAAVPQPFDPTSIPGTNTLTSSFAKGGLIPALALGGTLLSDGLFYGHRGERVTPAKAAPLSSTTVHLEIPVMVDGKEVGRAAQTFLLDEGRFGRPGLTPAS